MDVMAERPHLLNLAYRMLGSLADAEDVVQEAFARWYFLDQVERDAICSPAAWLTTVSSRLCLDQLRSARVRRERYVGEWIPDPVPDPSNWMATRDADPADKVTLDESISMAFLVVLDEMTPAERVSFILHDVFGYPFARVADIVGRTPAACRQLASSARRRVEAAQIPPAPVPQQAETVRRFKRAWDAQDIEALVELLDPTATAIADGGGRADAAPAPIEGAASIASYCMAFSSRRDADLSVSECMVNGRPGLLQTYQGEPATVFSFEIGADDRITRIWAIRNPDKLRAWRSSDGAAGQA